MADIASCVAAWQCALPILGLPAQRVWLKIEDMYPNFAKSLPSLPSFPEPPLPSVATVACAKDRGIMEKIAASLAARESSDADLIRRNADLTSRVENLEARLVRREEELAEARKDLMAVKANADAMEKAGAATKIKVGLGGSLQFQDPSRP